MRTKINLFSLFLILFFWGLPMPAIAVNPWDAVILKEAIRNRKNIKNNVIPGVKAREKAIADKLNEGFGKGIVKQKYHENMGAGFGDLMDNIWNDLKSLGKGIYGKHRHSCFAYSIKGICWKIEWGWPPKIKLDLVKQYRWPVAAVELSKHPGQSGYIHPLINRPMIKLAEKLEGSIAPSLVVSSNTFAAVKAGEMASFSREMARSKLKGTPKPEEPDLNGNPLTFLDNGEIKDAIDVIHDNFDDYRTRVGNASPAKNMYRYMEYRVLPPAGFDWIASALSRIPLLGFCHVIKHPSIPWASDWPGMNLFANSYLLNTGIFPFEVTNRITNPYGCIPTIKRPPMIAVSNYAFCIKYLGPYAPAFNRSTNLYSTQAAQLAFFRGTQLAATLNSFQFYPFASHPGDKPDKIMWTRGHNMTGKCHEFPKPSRYYGEHANEFEDPADPERTDDWRVGYHWKFFRCCKYDHRFCWKDRHHCYDIKQ
ncbi:MAG: hypothetical protein D6719_02105 [Candidatus Dadabacteria bacterium]|nr:MAG: hypothetical protein D6719_02105 [Candidatus Dadabacteria bacterium]